jgi:rhodanese-related sulfurtransferase
MKLWRVAVLVASGALLGLAWNAAAARGLVLTGHAFVAPGDVVVPAAEAKALLDRGALFLDARPRMFWEMSRIQGALALPEDDFEASFAALEPRLRASLDVVVYCSGFGCEASHIVARRLRERGVPAAVLEDGLPAWQDAGYPLDESPAR